MKNKRHSWDRERDDLILLSHAGKPAGEVAKLMGVSESAVYVNRKRLQTIQDTENRIKAERALALKAQPAEIAGPVTQGELIPPAPPELSEKAKRLLEGMKVDMNVALEMIASMDDKLGKVRFKCRSVSAQVGMLKNELGDNGQ